MSSRVEDKDGSEEIAGTVNRALASEESITLTMRSNQVPSGTESIATCGTSQETSAGQASDVRSSQRPNECCIVIPTSATSQPNTSNLMIIEARDLVHSIWSPKEFNLSSPRHVAGCSRNDDVTVNLSDFLTYARQNNCDIVIPTSTGRCYPSSSRLNSGHRIVISEQQNFPQPSSAATSYHPNEFIGLNHVSPRSSVLMPDLYSGQDDIRPPVVDFSAPPPYESPRKLPPSYEEVQREKELEADNPLTNCENQLQNALSSRTLSFLAVDGEAAAAAAAAADSESKLLGTDFMFAISFFLALIFNWVGFLLLLCFCHTVAARYGALSGFGLSLAKWTIVVKQASAAPLHNVWLWWLVAIFGLLICIRSLFQYIHIKRSWRLMSATMQERLLVYY